MSDPTDLEALATAIIGLSNDPEDSTELLRLLSQHSTLITSNHAALLSGLSFCEHSLACLYVLWSCRGEGGGSQNRGVDSEWMTAAGRFLKECDVSRLEGVRGKFLFVARTMKEDAISMGRPRLAILPLRHAVRKFAPTPDHLTPLHADFFQLCLLAKNYAAAKEVLFSEVYEMDPEHTFLTSTSFLLYCYYGGRLCIGLKCHQRALELFHLALVAPTSASNAITLIIYKHYALVSLMVIGKVPDLPRYCSGAVLRLVRSPSMTPYLRLTEAYQDLKADAVESVVHEFKQSFEEDKCMGLVKQVVASLIQRDVKALTRSYVTRSLPDVAEATGFSTETRTEQVLLQLAKEKQIDVKISCRNRMVTFMDDTDTYDTAEATAQLDGLIQEVMQLGVRMQDIEDKIELDPEYRNKVLQTKQHSKLDC